MTKDALGEQMPESGMGDVQAWGAEMPVHDGAPDAAGLFDGPGEMRARARAFDWAGTSLGPVEEWSPTLRTVVRLCLDSPFPVNLWCGRDRVLIYNDGYRRVLGAKHPQALGQPGFDVWKEILPDIEPMFAQIDAGGPPIYAENAPFVMTRRDDESVGELAYFTFGLSAIRDESGAIVAYFNPATETTARVAAETALAATQRRLDAALLAGEVGTYQWDIPDDRLWGDANFARIFQIQLDETGAAPLAAYVAAIHEDDRERTLGLVQRTLETGAPYEAEYRIIVEDEHGRSTRWVEARGRMEYDEAGRPLRFSGVVQDVTRRHEAEAERERLLAVAQNALQEAQVANRAKNQFLASMSHELRTPLNAIGGYTQLLEMEIHGPLAEGQRETLQRVQRAQKHLLNLINDLLDYAKIESGKMEYVVRPVAVREVVTEVLAMVEPLTAARELTVTVVQREADEEPLAWADRDKLAQVLLNLVSNALKFTSRGGRIEVVVEPTSEEPAQVLVHVRDTGIGIPEQKLQEIFEPFVQLRSGNPNEGAKTRGTGLGLAISREFARGMGGELSVASTVGEGSVFTVHLRRAT